MMMKKKFLCFLVAVLMVCTNVAFVSANAGLQASPVFVSKSVSLSSSMNGSMSCGTSVICSKIYISSVKLQTLTNGSWGNDVSVPCPTAVATNDASLSASRSYASYCTKGVTYRLYVTFWADGVTATAYSGGTTY